MGSQSVRTGVAWLVGALGRGALHYGARGGTLGCDVISIDSTLSIFIAKIDFDLIL